MGEINKKQMSQDNTRHQQEKNQVNKPSSPSTPKQRYSRRSPNAHQPLATEEAFRSIFAAYFNMARANLYSVLRYVSVQCGLEVKQDEDSMHELAVAQFASNKRPEVRQKVFSLLMRHIPVLQQMTQSKLIQARPQKGGKSAIEAHLVVEQQDVQQVLQNIIRIVNFQRNRFTHANHYDTLEEKNKETQREKELYRPLETAFKGSKREVKRIFCYTSEEMKFVDQEEHMKRILMKDKTGEVIKDEKGRDQYIFVEHEDWFFRLFNTIADPITGMPLPKELTTAGLVFLLSKLLHKKYATQLAQQSGLFRTKEQGGYSPFKGKENEVMFNIFCTHRIRLPKGRVESTSSDSALGLDMLNELQKCPSELFETLHSDNKKLFQVDRKDGKPQPEPDDDINLFRRNGDRFPLLALKYIDVMRGSENEKDRVLKDVVFQVSLGKFRYKFCNRASLDTTEKNRLRVLQKEINGFGPIGKVEELRKRKYGTYIRPISDDPEHLYDADTADTSPYLTDHHASYAITGDRIGITWNTVVQKPGSDEKRKSIRIKWNDQSMEKLDNDNCFLPSLSTPEENIAPRAWLSIYDLPGMIFLSLIGGNPEAVIKDTYNRFVILLNDISDGKLKPQKNKEDLEKLLSSEPYKFHICDIPQKLIEYLIGKAPQTETEADDKFNQWVNLQLDGDTQYDSLIFLLRDIKKGVLKPKVKGRVPEENLKKTLRKDYNLFEEEVPCRIKDYLLGRIHINSDKEKKKFLSYVKRLLAENEEQNITSIILKLEKRIKKFESDLKQIGDKQNRIGRKGYVDIRPGSLARYIAKDIMVMTSPDKSRKNNGKPSGLDFGVLQAEIATYKSDEVELALTPLGKMLTSAINVSNHPFLNAVMKDKVSDTIDLYRKYQTEKLNYLVALRKGKKGLYKDQWFLREAYRNHAAKTPDYIQGANGLASRYLDTLQLPNGLFTESICQELSENPDTRECQQLKAALSNKEKSCGVSHLIYLYFVNVLGDNSQSFYREMKRHYTLLDWVNFKQNPEKQVPILPTLVPRELYFSDEEISTMLRKGQMKYAPVRTGINNIANRLQTKIGEKEIIVDGEKKIVSDYGNEGSASDKEKDAFFEKLIHQLRVLQKKERNIRRYRNQDMLLFLMAKKILLSGGVVFAENANIEKGIDQFKLKDITPPACNTGESMSLLEMPVEFSLTIGMNDEKGKPINSAEGKQMFRTIHQDAIKLKNYGDFFTFLYDSRIGGLLSQLPTEDIIERSKLEDELDSYDRNRLKVFAILQAIERRIINEHPELADKNAGGQGFYDADGKPYRNSFSGLLSLCKQYLANDNELNDLGYGIVDIRNAFSHNRYTNSDNNNIDISNMTLPQVAALILEWLKKQE